ncbi:PROTEIN TRICHOME BIREFRINGENCE-LIKE 9-RELATED, partial [Salix purpurea]
MSFRFHSGSSLTAAVSLLLLVYKASASGCDFFTGSWVVDGSYPLYNASACPFIEREFSCQNNGRPDSLYTTFRWKPLHCNLQ